jgi:hypothetical protein
MNYCKALASQVTGFGSDLLADYEGCVPDDGLA